MDLPLYPGGAVHVVTDRNVASIYGDDIQRWLAGSPQRPGPPPGRTQELRHGQGDLRVLARGNAGRDSLVVASAAGRRDLAGFAAATYLRGSPPSSAHDPPFPGGQQRGWKDGFNLPRENLSGRSTSPGPSHRRRLPADPRRSQPPCGDGRGVKCALAGTRIWTGFSRSAGSGGALRGSGAGSSAGPSRSRRPSSSGTRGRPRFAESSISGTPSATRWRNPAALATSSRRGGGDRAGLGGDPRDEARRDRESLVDDLVSLLIGMGFPLDDPGVALTSIAAATGWTRSGWCRTWTCRWSPPRAVANAARPLAEIRRELPGIRAEIRERSITRVLNVRAGDAIPEESPVSNLVHVGDEVYEIRSAEENAAPAVLAEAGPAVGQEQAEVLAAPEPGPAPTEIPSISPCRNGAVDTPAAPAVRTVTLADVYWSQESIHREADRGRSSATTQRTYGPRHGWRPGPGTVSWSGTPRVLETMAKEYGYDLLEILERCTGRIKV